ncbi:MAG TPA: hypothetical protein VFQ23_16050 [Anaerolineales bacterium]|nr:hypothetical protein [Anaerolineales bacterium]
MKTLNLIYHMLRADFLERTRRSSFFVTLGLAVLIGYIYIPPADSSTLMLALGPWRGAYNSAWIGSVFGILIVISMPVLGFFLTKNTIERDRRSRVGQILATTPMSKPIYTLGKWLSNMAVLTAMLVVLNLMAIVMQLLRGEIFPIDYWALSAPIWLMGFPIIALTAAMAVLFESIPFLSGSAGNVIYFLGWYIFMDNLAVPGIFRYNIGVVEPWLDPLGVTGLLAALQSVGQQVAPQFSGHINFGGAEFGVVPQVVTFAGIQWSLTIMLGRLAWFGIAGLLALAASFPFDRFDPARTSVDGTSVLKSLLPNRPRRQPLAEPAFAESKPVNLTPINHRNSRSRFLSLLNAEFKLLVKGKPWWWYLVAAFISLLGLIGPPGGSDVTLALAMIWPVIAWSALGMRETFYETYKLTYSSAHPLGHQFMASWFSGVLLATLAISGATVRMVIEGGADRLPLILLAVLFVPSLAMALGTWSNNSRLFEVVYLLWLFNGVNGAVPLDFMQVLQTSPNPILLAAYFALTVVLFAASLAGRWKQLYAN